MKCPNCGGKIIFNVQEQNLKCEYCSSSFNPDEYKQDELNSKNEFSENELKVDRYFCKNCGAELCATEEQIVSYCFYCGGETSLVQKSDVMEKPVGIIPFKISKEQVQENYRKHISKKIFVPKELKDSNFIEGFRGIYIPYWKTKSKVEQETANLEGSETEYTSSYTYIRYYDYKVKFKEDFDSGSFDASESFDDTIASEIAPFHTDEIKTFNESYLAGFYADKVTAPLETYEKKIDERMLESVKKELEIATNGLETKDSNIKSKVKWSLSKKESLLFPIWFLTWRNKNRVAYSVMNGETGNMSIDLPVDMKKLFLSAFVLALIIFGILTLLPTFILPLKLASYSSLILYFCGWILRSELREVKLIENHFFDLGKKNKTKIKNRKSERFNSFIYVSRFLIFVSVITSTFDATKTKDILFPIFIVLIAQTVLCVRQILEIIKIKNKIAIATAIISVLIHVISIFVVLYNPQADFWYYGISSIALIGMILNIVTCISYINFLTTRPVPNFFEREGADNGK